MPTVDEIVAVEADPSYSLIHYEAGLLEKVTLDYGGGIGPVVVRVQQRNKAGNWVTEWESPSTNTSDSYSPAKTTTLDDGSAGAGESLIPLRSPYGWRIEVEGDDAGTVTVQISLDGNQAA